jgi:arabinogalactan oligomer / maltooligosaccharide transport system permease protein
MTQLLEPAERRPTPGRPAGSGRTGRSAALLPPGELRSVPAYLVKMGLLAGVVALAVYGLPQLYSKKEWGGFAAVAASTVLILWVYLSPRRIHLKYLVPGTLLLLAFMVYPIAYLIQISFTNFGDGHLVTKQQAIAAITNDSVQPVPNAPTYVLTVATKGNPADPEANFVFLLTAPDGKVYVGTSSGISAVPLRPVTLSPTGGVTAAPGYRILSPIEVNNLGSRLQGFSVPLPRNQFIRSLGISEAYIGKATMRYVAKTDTFVNLTTGTTYRPENGQFVATNGSGDTLSAGWKSNVGLANYTAVFKDPDIRGPFLKILAWTFSFALITVTVTFFFGLFLAVVLNHPRLRGRVLYRSILLLPYAMPAFISILVWASMFNQEFGLINSILHVHINWLGSEWWAKSAILLTSLWLGFPYMFLVSLGVLQSVPSDLLEAAHVDGAGGLRAFRHITFPLLLVAVEPLLIASFAFNFNNFNMIQFLTGGAPFTYGSVEAGSTDIVISYTYRLAFGGAGAQYGFAAALSVLLFIMVGTISIIGFRRTQALRTMT